MSYPIYLNWGELAEDVDAEFRRARELFPGSKNNTLALGEEHGELVKAALDHSQGKATIDEVRKELIQTMAMCLRLYFDGDSAIDLPPVSDFKLVK